jgi:hypothetical protein
MMGGAGKDGPRKLARQPCHAVCLDGHAEDSTDRGEENHKGSVTNA